MTSSPTIDVPLPFPADSALRLVFRERIVQFSGLRAILMQALSPVMVAGFLEHTNMFESHEHTVRRLIRTGIQMNQIYFSEDVDAIQQLCAGLRHGHGYVNGVLPESAGVAAGRQYRANDPENLLWVIATTADSAWKFYELWRGGNSQMKEAFWREYRVVGRLFGLSEADLPTDWEALQFFINTVGRSYRPLPEAIELGRALVSNMSPPGLAKLLVPVVQAATVDSLPPWARKSYGFGWDPVRSLLYQNTVRSQRLPSQFMLPQFRFVPESRGQFPTVPPMMTTNGHR